LRGNGGQGDPAAGGKLVCVQTQPSLASMSLRSLPPDLIHQSRVRLSWVAGATIVATIVMAVLARFLQPEVAEAQKYPAVRLALGGTVAASLALIGMELSRRVAAVTVLRAGLIYEVLIAAAIAVVENAMPWESGVVVRGMSSITLWLAAFALLVPAPPLTACLFSLAAAAMGPVVHFALTAMLGFPPAALNRLLIYYLPPALMAIAAALINRRLLELEFAAARGREMGSYELEEKLAQGGMGEVWRARHRLLKREAAVKLIRPEMLLAQTGSGPDVLLRRFEQEARAISSLRSPHTVELYDFGMTVDGGLYYAMELLDGLDLERMVKRFGSQPPARVIHILCQACVSLEEAHRRGMVHRDIKPTNLFLCRLGVTYDFCKLLDFGLVKSFLHEDDALVTAAGGTAGTPAFMAPEIAKGARELDGRVDLYGLGCVGYWLLSGRLVFAEPNPVAMAIAHVQKVPEPLSRVTEIVVPVELERLLMRCLAKDPAERPQSAAEMRRLLESCPGAGTWTEARAEEWWRHHLPEEAGGSGEPTHTPSSTGPGDRPEAG